MTLKRTTKALASRIQVDYLKKFIPFRYWKRVLWGGLTAAAAIWILTATFSGKKEIHTPGPTSDGHRMFQNECSECHTVAGKKVSNDACLKCHSDLIHHPEQAFEPRCADCHIEHRGRDLVDGIGPWNCAACHKDLERKDGKKPGVASGIKRIDKGHPEFRFLTAGRPDPTAMKLNHRVHMKPDLEGPEGEKVTLQCGDCHGVDLKKDPQGLYRNAFPTYEKNCRDCHALGFDRDFPKAVVPHKKTEEVRAFLHTYYRAELAKDPALFKKSPERTLPGPLGRDTSYSSGDEWFRSKIAAAEKQLFNKACLECHDWKYTPDTIPEVPKFTMVARYLEHGRFDHAAHRPIACASCHVKALESEKTSDFLVPSITTCIECHQTGGLARDACFECHRYHTPGPEKVMEGKFRIPKTLWK